MIDNIKELLETQRGKGLVKLGLFLAFFLIIFIYYGFTSEVPRVKPKDALESFGEMTNYEYIYTLNDITYNGKAYHSKLYFAIDSNEYLVDDNTYLKNIDGEYIITELDKLYYYDNISIYNLIKNGSVVSKTEDFENDTTITKYLSDDIYLETYLKNDTIYKVSLEVENNFISIEYMNIGQVLNPAN